MPRVMSITCAVAGALIAAAAPNAFAQDSTYSPWRPGTVTSPGGNPETPASGAAAADTTYIRQALRGNLAEVNLGRIAEDRAENADVKAFGERMVEDHNSMNERWAALAKSNGMRWELGLDPETKQAADRLDDLDDAAFDQAYMTEMIQRHEQDLAALQQISRSARSSDVRELAIDAQSAVREHLSRAQQVGSRVGVASTAGRVGNPWPRTSDTSTNPWPTTNDTSRRRTTDDRVARNDRDDRDERNDRDESGTLRREDRAFVENVLSDHLMHVRLANRAKREANSSEVRRFAERMEKEFSGWAERWDRFADRRNANVTARLEKHNREKLQRLDKAAERKDFDRVYAEIVADHLEMMMHDFRDEAQEDRPGPVRQVIQKEVPTISQLLVDARKLERQAEDRTKAVEARAKAEEDRTKAKDSDKK